MRPICDLASTGSSGIGLRQRFAGEWSVDTQSTDDADDFSMPDIFS